MLKNNTENKHFYLDSIKPSRALSSLNASLHSYQANKNTKQLNDVSVGHWVEPANEGVEHRDTGRQHHGLSERQVQYHGQGGAWVWGEHHGHKQVFR